MEVVILTEKKGASEGRKAENPKSAARIES
jgi:hypothetical protein